MEKDKIILYKAIKYLEKKMTYQEYMNKKEMQHLLGILYENNVVDVITEYKKSIKIIKKNLFTLEDKYKELEKENRRLRRKIKKNEK